jgi:lipoprotein-releasing system permease protein
MKDTYPYIFSWLDITDQNAVIILTIMAIVAIINLAVALIILIVEQARMVGILKAQGMALNQVRMVFLYYAGLIAGCGIVIGNLVALALGWVQIRTGSMTRVPFRIVWWHIAVIDVATLLLCIACMLLPTLYLRRVQPARVLHFK